MMKKSLKIILIIILVGCLGFEGWFIVKKNKKEAVNTIISEDSFTEEVADNSKYLVDPTATYKPNDLTYKMIHEDVYYYLQIDGLKNKEVQNKINNKIKDRTLAIKKSILDSYRDELEEYDDDIKHTLDIASVKRSSFSNTLSVEIGVSYDYDEKEKENNSIYSPLDSLNFDLRTGDELKITDIFVNPNVIREELSSNAYSNIYIGIGIVCWDGPCNNPKPHYERVEDGVISIINQFNSGKFKFAFDEKELSLFFFDSYINSPKLVIYNKKDKEMKNLIKKCDKLYDDEYVCNDNYITNYEGYIKLNDYFDNLIVYNKFVTNESLFEKNEEKELTVFTTNKLEDSFLYEKGDNLYDFSSDYYMFLDDDYKDPLFETVIEESSNLKTNEKNIWRFVKNRYELAKNYTWFNVYHYKVPGDKYEEIKKKVYAYRNKTDEKTYSFLNEYKTKDAYYYYITDENGKMYNSQSLINYKYNWESVIPQKWLEGKYKTIKDLLDNAYIIADKDYKFNDRLVIYAVEVGSDVFELEYTLYYNGETIKINIYDYTENGPLIIYEDEEEYVDENEDVNEIEEFIEGEED